MFRKLALAFSLFGIFALSTSAQFNPTTGRNVTGVLAAQSVSLTGQTAAIGTATVCSTANCPAGEYQVNIYIVSTATCSLAGPAVIAPTLSWTDDSGAKSGQAVPMAVLGGVTLLTSLVLGTTTGNATASVNLWSTGAQPIQYAVSYTGCTTGTGTYSVRIAVIRLI